MRWRKPQLWGNHLTKGLVISVAAGIIIGKIDMEDQLEDWVQGIRFVTPGRGDEGTPSSGDRINAGRAHVKDIVGKVWPYIVVGIAVGAGIHTRSRDSERRAISTVTSSALSVFRELAFCGRLAAVCNCGPRYSGTVVTDVRQLRSHNTPLLRTPSDCGILIEQHARANRVHQRVHDDFSSVV